MLPSLPRKMVRSLSLILSECLFVEASAMTGENVEEVFSKLTSTLMYKIDSGDIPEDLVTAPKSSIQSNVNLDKANETAQDSYYCANC